MNEDLKIYNFYQDIVNLINNSKLPLSVIELIIEKILTEVKQQKIKIIQTAMAEKAKQHQEEN